MHKFVLYTGGGLGDFYVQYFMNSWAKLHTLRDIGFTSTIHSYHNSHNLSTLAMTTYIPNTTQEYHNYVRHFHDIKEQLKIEQHHIDIESMFDFSKIASKEVPIYLAPGEQEVIDHLPDKFITIHPQAGTADRAMLCYLDMNILLTEVSKLAPIVLLGGSGERTGFNRSLRETGDYGVPVIDFVNSQSARVQTQAIKDCNMFIGSFSAYFVAALGLNKNAIVTVDEHSYNRIQKDQSSKYFTITKDSPLVSIYNWNYKDKRLATAQILELIYDRWTNLPNL